MITLSRWWKLKLFRVWGIQGGGTPLPPFIIHVSHSPSSLLALRNPFAHDDDDGKGKEDGGSNRRPKQSPVHVFWDFPPMLIP